MSNLSSHGTVAEKVEFEYNVNLPANTGSVCNMTLMISSLLYFSEMVIEILLIIQWIHVQYFIPVIVLSCFMLMANICNIYQWYTFRISSNWIRHLRFVIPIFGLMGLLPWICMLCHLCTASCCARMEFCDTTHTVTEMSVLKAKQSMQNDSKSDRLLSDSAVKPLYSDVVVSERPLSNLAHLWAMQLMIRFGT